MVVAIVGAMVEAFVVTMVAAARMKVERLQYGLNGSCRGTSRDSNSSFEVALMKFPNDVKKRFDSFLSEMTE